MNRIYLDYLFVHSHYMSTDSFVRKIVSIFKSIIHYQCWPFNLAFSSDSIQNRNLWITNKQASKQASKQTNSNTPKKICSCVWVSGFQRISETSIDSMHACMWRQDKRCVFIFFSSTKINQTKKNTDENELINDQPKSNVYEPNFCHP